MTAPDAPDRYDRILHTVGSVFDSLGVWPDHPRALETLADAVEQLIDGELEASQRRAIRIQTLLDETRDRARKDFAASCESERQLQQQIDAQAKEIDRLRDAHRHEEELSADLRARLKATSDACSDATTLLYRIGELHTTELSNEFGATECRTCRDPWPCDTASLLAALEQPEDPAARPEWDVWPMGTLRRPTTSAPDVPPALRGPGSKPQG